jgi:hypothetical protein
MAKYQLFNNMNSPQPLSASQRWAKRCTPPSFDCKEGGRGDEYMKNVLMI